MRDGERRLEQNKTLGRLQTVRSAPNGLVGKRIVIDDGIVAAQGQFESIFPSGGAMTWTGVAAHLGHHGQNMITKTPHKRNSKVLDIHRHCSMKTVIGSCQNGVTIPFGMNKTFLVDQGNAEFEVWTCACAVRSASCPSAYTPSTTIRWLRRGMARETEEGRILIPVSGAEL